ncbi:hypothetical protein [Ruminococcus flavefaciens]|uniref:hypothetical protein n=1 Tax=Ruminococcus flavefaciens TaxID=1265 RepID=UPI00048A9F9F|nr:hypothetical protein [Ruminococcus flavefaciens]
MNIKDKFRKKVAECYQKYKQEWENESNEYLIANAERIAVINKIVEMLPDITNDYEMNYLIRFKNPLTVIVDELVTWYGLNTQVLNENLGRVLFTIADRQDLDSDYDMELSDFSEDNFIAMGGDVL